MRPLFLFSTLFFAQIAHAAPTFLDDEAERSCNLAFSLAAPPANGKLQIVFDWQDEKNFYALDATPQGMTVSATVGGAKRTLDSASFAWKAQNALTVQRRPWLMQVVCNGRAVLTAYDAAFTTGKIGAQGQNWNWKEPRVQPVEAIRFDDDFTRAGSAGDNQWKVATGKWELTASSENINAGNAEKSSNPFAFEAKTPSSAALASTGRWFWDNYDARTSVRPDNPGQVGVAAYVQDAQNYLAFWWSSSEGVSARRLVRVENGKETTLDQAAGAFLPRNWYQIGLRTSPGYLEALIDGVPVLRAPTDGFGQGGVGLLARNIGAAAFDDVQVRSYDFYRQEFRAAKGLWTPANGSWTPEGGVWLGQNGVLTASPRAGEGPKTRVLLAGRPDWDDFQLFASARAGQNGACGLVAGWKDEKNYTVFRWAGEKSVLPFRGRQQLLRYFAGRATVLSDEPLSLVKKADKDGFVRLNLRTEAGALAIYAGGELVAQVGDETLGAGRPALWAQGVAPSAFRDVVLFFSPPSEAPKVAPKMEDDPYMVGWASPTGEWPPTQTDNGLEFWNTGEFFGDATLEFAWRQNWRGSLEVALRAEREKFDSGAVLKGESADDGASVLWTLSREGKVLKSAKTKVADLEGALSEDGAPLKITLAGRGILLAASGKPILSHLEAAPARGRALGVRAQKFRIRADRLRATSQNRDDYTFTEAPTDFYSLGGAWHVFSRWPCHGDWSFFGGNGRNPILWSKRTYRGAMVVEGYVHNQMDLPKEIGYSRPGDLNVSLAGDGKNPFSGYSFVVAGWSNTKTRLFRGTQAVAEKDGPEADFEAPSNHNNKWHKKWFYLRAEARPAEKDGKKGVEISLSLDDKELLSFFDQNPLPAVQTGGRVAFWTTDGTMMIARAKIEAEFLGTKSLPVGLGGLTASTTALPNNAPRPLEENGAPTALVRAENGGWRVSNPQTGGAFAVALDGAALTIRPDSQLRCELQLPAATKIDLYLQRGDENYLVELTGHQRPDALAISLGAANIPPPSSGPSSVVFDVGSALQKQFPGEKSWKIDRVVLGALHGDPYRWLGMDGNQVGANYWVGSWKVE